MFYVLGEAVLYWIISREHAPRCSHDVRTFVLALYEY